MVFTFNRPHIKNLDGNKFLEKKKAQEILTNLEMLTRKIGTHAKSNSQSLHVELSGGLAIPLTISQRPEIAKFLNLPLEQRGIYRNHNAFHLSMHAPELVRLENILANPIHREARYELVTHPFSTTLNPFHTDMAWVDWKVDRYEKVSAQQAINEKVHNLRFVEINASGDIITPHKTRLSYLDVYPFQYESQKGILLKPWYEGRFVALNTGSISDGDTTFSANETKVVSWDKHEIKLSAQLYYPIEVMIGPCKIRVAGLPWIRAVKEEREKQDDVDRHDINLINQYLKIKGV